MMAKVSLESEIEQTLWAEALATATELCNITVCKPDGFESCYEKLFGKEPPLLGYLKIFGTVCFVTKRNIRSKYESRSIKCIVLGCARDPAPDCYRFLNLETNKVILSRDVTWKEEQPIMKENTDTVEEQSRMKENTDVEEEQPIIEQSKVEQPVMESFSDEENQNKSSNEESDSGSSDEGHRDKLNVRIDQLQCLFMGGKGKNDTAVPDKYSEAINQVSWRKAMIKELNSIKQRDVWEPVKAIDVKNGTRILSTRWLYTVKSDGTCKVRLVAMGRFQRPGLDYWETFAPVVSDSIIRMALCVANNRNWEIQQRLTLRQHS